MKSPVEIAKEAVRKGGEVLVPLLGKTAIELKDSTYNLVTAGDRNAEEAIVNFLSRETPGCAFLGEEAHHEARLSEERLWIIDPLDGTTNFAHSIPHFGVSVGYAEKGRLVAGAVYDPMRDELFSAQAGCGAFCNGRSIAVSKRSPLSQTLIATGFYYDRGALMEKTLKGLHHLFRSNIRCMRRMGAASLDLTWLACGRYDGYFEYELSPWDFAAGLLILLEAGGMASDPEGKKADLFSKGLLCSNGLIHDELLRCTLDPGKFDI
jgi:myo-inositol-1(or 4)-monophosphatase